MARYVALLRGINVGGKNLIRMVELAACFEASGFTRVQTYIASGNVLFESSQSATKLVPHIERTLSAQFGYEASVVLQSQQQLAKVIGRAPERFGGAPERFRYDVLFLKPPLTAAAALRVVPIKEGVDQVFAGPGVLYYSRLISKATQSRLSKVVSMPIYQQMTIRNWNTTTKLLALMTA